jgi:hypothetical protein
MAILLTLDFLVAIPLLVANIFANFPSYLKMALKGLSGAQGKLIPEEKPRDTIPLKFPTYGQR